MVGAVVTFLDITERKQAEEALQQSEKRMKGLVEHLPEGVCLLDRDARLIFANTTAREYLHEIGYAPEEEALSHIGAFTLEEVETPREDGLPREVTVEGPPPRVFEVEAHAVAGEEGARVLLIREVTREREVQERVHQQDRLAAIGQLAAGIAHDFNNMLAVMTGTAQIMSMNPNVRDAEKADLNTIFSQGQRAAQLVRQILDFSRKTVTERQPLGLAPFLKEQIKLLEQVLPENIRIVSEMGAGEYIVNASLTQLQQVVANLAVNARDAMPEGGELRIGFSRLRVDPDERPPLVGMEPGDWVVWTVSDTGAGMPPDVQKHIFEPFFTTKPRGEGTGLGLAQVYGIVKQHGGEIHVKSQKGKGTTFTIYLPELARAPVRVEEAGGEIPTGNGETVLVVEDEADVRGMARRLLEELNYRVLVASDGQEALVVYAERRDEISLVLSDMMMPEMGGVQLFRALKEQNPEVRVVIMTGYPLDGAELQMQQELAGVLEKPFELERVARVVGDALKTDPDERDESRR